MEEEKTLTADFVEKLKARGLTFATPQTKPSINLPVKETKEVAILFCDIANRAVNKSGFIDVSFGKIVFDAAMGVNKVPGEILDIDESEVVEIHQTVKENLHFDNPDAQRDEKLAEDITLGVLTIVLGIADRIR